MKSSFRKRTALLLALLSVSSTLAACGGDTAGTSDTTVSGGADTTTAPIETEDPRLSIDDGLPDVDLEGYKFRILPCYPNGMTGAVSLYAPDTDTGEIVDSAAYKRNQKIEERFNCEIVLVDDGGGRAYDVHAQHVKTLVMAGEDEFDISLNHCIFGVSSSLEGIFTNLSDMEYQDFTKPWYSQNTVENFLVNNKMYFIPDIIGLEAVSYAEVVYLNRQLFADYNIELPYNDVFEGKWTLDKMTSIAKSVYKDVNGNTEKDTTDEYGFVSIPNQNAWLATLGVKTVEKSSDGTLKNVANNDRMITSVEKLYELLFNSEGTFVTKGKDEATGLSGFNWAIDMFANGHTLMTSAQLSIASGTLRKSSVEYGIIPMPKLDENQENYITSAYSGNLIAVPITITEPKKTSIILEALLAESYKSVVPTYMETALKDKYANDAESRDCLDIIFDSLVVPFESVYMDFTGFNSTLSSMFNVDTPTTDFVSYYAGRKDATEARLAKVQEFFQSDN